MSITVTFTGENLAQIEQQALDFLTGTMSDDQIVGLIETLAETVDIIPTRKPVAAPEPLAAQLKEQVAPPLDPAPSATPVSLTITDGTDPVSTGEVGAPPPGAMADAPDYAIVREAVLRLAVVKTPEITRAVLDRYGVRRAADLDPSRWAALLADVIAAMA